MVTLVFVAVLLAAVALDVWLIRPLERRRSTAKMGDAEGTLEVIVPRTLFFHPGHTWARLDGDGRVTVGIDDLARTLVGNLSTVELPTVGTTVNAGEPAFAIGQGPRRVAFAAPVSGTVVDTNAALGMDPVRLRWRPYKEGWVVRLAPGDRLPTELAGLKIGIDAARWMRSELERLDQLFARGVLGLPAEGSLERAGDGAWAVFGREVLGSGDQPEGRTV